MSYEKLMIAVDGGGTKTEAVLFTGKGKILKRLLGAGSNPNTAGREKAVETLQNLIKNISEGYDTIEGIFIGCAGCGTGDNAKIITKALESHFDCPVQCVSDILTAAKSITDEDCFCCISGTGNTIALIKENTFRLFSGTGPLLGERGSGCSLGRDALLHAIEERDFGITPDSLTLAVEKKINGPVREKISEIYEKGTAFIADFAKTVFDEYENCESAKNILEDNAIYITSLINELQTLYPDITVTALTGSLFRNEIFRNAVKNAVDTRCIFTDAPQLTGAAILCLQMCGINAGSIREIFTKNYFEFITGDNNA